MSKICFINQMAPSYRFAIYKEIEHKWNVDWYFGNQVGDIKEMDISALNNVIRFNTISLLGHFYWQRGIVTLLKNINQYDTFIIHAEPYNLSALWLMILNKILRKHKKIILWSHGWYGREGILKKWFKRLFFGLSDYNLLYGGFAKEVAIEQGNNGKKCLIIHNSLDYTTQLRYRECLSISSIYTEYFHNSNPVIVFVGRLTSVKRLDILIKAIGILNKRGECYNLFFIGSGAERKNLESLAKEENIHAWFYGESYKESELSSLIYNADLCVSPGNVGLTAMHSMVYGTPVITHDNFSNQMPEFESIVKGVTGDFFQFNSVDSLADTISNWFAKNRTKRNDIRKNCYDEIDKNWNPQFQLNILSQIL